MDEPKVEKKRGKRVGIPENLMESVIEKSLQTHENTLGHDQNGVAMVEIPPESEPTRPADPEATGLELAAAEISAAADTPIKKRGRPPGSRNKKPSPRRRLQPFPIKTRKRGRPPTEEKKKSSPDPDKMVRFTTTIPSDLIERLKNCVYYSPGMTVTEVVSSGVRKQLHLLEKKNKGKFKNRPSTNLKSGRKLK